MKHKKILVLVLTLIAVFSLASLSVNSYAAGKKVTISPVKVTLKKGEEKQLKFTCKKGVLIKKSSFASKNKKIATVTKKGRIIAKRKGNTTIRVKVSYKYKKKSMNTFFTVKVIVKDDGKDDLPTVDKLAIVEKNIISSAEKKKQSILSTKSDWTLGENGTIYYVSTNGNDNNDGLTPETAWATLNKVNSAFKSQLNEEEFNFFYTEEQFPEYIWAKNHPDQCANLKSGDVVLFERGGTWRGVLRTVPGVTYSAYGTGEKPKILGSPENGTGKEKWKLVDKTNNVWEFYKDMQDCGGILLGKDKVACKDFPFWSHEKQAYINIRNKDSVSIEELNQAPLYDKTKLENLHFFNELKFKGNVYEDPSMIFSGTGKLYLRCDAGNPGEVYDSIEFFTGNNAYNQGLASSQDNITVDNLAFYYSSVGVNFQQASHITVQNCDVRHGGGAVQAYQIDNDEASVIRCGDGIQIGGTGNCAKNNYVSNYFDCGISIEEYWYDGAESENPRKDITVSGNLIEYCDSGIMVSDWVVWMHPDREYFPSVSNVLIENNMVMYANMNGWSRQNRFQEGFTLSGCLALFLNSGCSSITIRNNTLFQSSQIGQLLTYHYMDGVKPPVTFDGNTYIQSSGGKVAQIVRFSLKNNRYEGNIYEDINQDSAAFDNLRKLTGDMNIVTLDNYTVTLEN